MRNVPTGEIRNSTLQDFLKQKILEIEGRKNDDGTPHLISNAKFKKELLAALYDRFKQQNEAAPLNNVLKALEEIKLQDDNPTRIKAPLDELINELKVATNIEVPQLAVIDTNDKVSYHDSTKKVKGQTPQLWDQGAWLLCVADKHPLQWAIERNLEIQRLGQDDKRSKLPINFVTLNGEEPILAATRLEQEGQVKFRIPISEWTRIRQQKIQNNLSEQEVLLEEAKFYDRQQNEARKIKISSPISADNLAADVLKIIGNSVLGVSEDGSTLRSEDLFKRVLSDLGKLQNEISKLSEEQKQALSKPLPKDFPREEIRGLPILINGVLSPTFIYALTASAVPDKSVEGAQEERSKFFTGNNSPEPLLQALQVASTSITPRIERGSRSYNNWLENLSELAAIAMPSIDDDELSLKKLARKSFEAVCNFAGRKSDDLEGKDIVTAYISEQEGFKQKALGIHIRNPKSPEIDPRLEQIFNKVIKEAEAAKKGTTWSASEIKARLCAELLQGTFKIVEIDQVYQCCIKYLGENKDSPVKDQLLLVLDELQIANSFTSLDSHMQEFKGLQVQWKNGPWLKDLQYKHVLQWGLEHNDNLAKDHKKGQRLKDEYIAIDSKDKLKPSQDLLGCAYEREIKFADKKGLKIPVIKWTDANDIQLNDTQKAKDAVMQSRAFARDRFFLFESAVESKDDDQIAAYIDKAIKQPHIVDCQRAARHLIINDERYKGLIDETPILELCEKSGVKFEDSEQRSLDNLFKKIGDDKLLNKIVRDNIRELLYDKSKNLVDKIKHGVDLGENIEELQLKLDRCDQLYNLFSSPSFLDQERSEHGVDSNCRLLGDDSKLATMFKSHTVEDIATQLDRGRIYNRSLGEKLWAGLKIVAGTVVGGAAGSVVSQAAGTGKTLGIVAGAVVGGAGTAAAQSIGNFTDRLNKGEVKFDHSESSSAKITCTAQLRRQVDEATDIASKKQERAQDNILYRFGRYVATACNRLLPSNNKLAREIDNANTEMETHAAAFDAKEGMFWTELADKARTLSKQAGKDFSSKIMGVMKVVSGGISGFAEGAWDGIKTYATANDTEQPVATVEQTATKSDVNKAQSRDSSPKREAATKPVRERRSGDQNDETTNCYGTESGSDKEPWWVESGGKKIGQKLGSRPSSSPRPTTGEMVHGGHVIDAQ